MNSIINKIKMETYNIQNDNTLYWELKFNDIVTVKDVIDWLRNSFLKHKFYFIIDEKEYYTFDSINCLHVDIDMSEVIDKIVHSVNGNEEKKIDIVYIKTL